MSNQEESRWKDIYAKFTEENVVQDIANKDLESLFREIEQDQLDTEKMRIYTTPEDSSTPSNTRCYALLMGVSDEDSQLVWVDENLKWWQDNKIYCGWLNNDRFRIDPSDENTEVHNYHFRGWLKYLPKGIKFILVKTKVRRSFALHFIGKVPIILTKPLTFPEWLHEIIHNWSFDGEAGSIREKILWTKWFDVLGKVTGWINNLAIHAYPDWVGDRLPDDIRKHSTIFFRYEPAQEED